MKPGKSKVRGKRYRVKKGPLFVVDDDSQGLVRALRNVPGVDTVHVSRLNIRLLAPGGQLGRLTIYTQGALSKLGAEFGNVNGGSIRKDYKLKREMIKNPDISAIINSDEIQSVLRDKKKNVVLHPRQKKNPLKNKKLMDKLNPYQSSLRSDRRKKIAKNKEQGKQHKEKVLNFMSQMEEKIGER